jgi:hypothetical protein
VQAEPFQNTANKKASVYSAESLAISSIAPYQTQSLASQRRVDAATIKTVPYGSPRENQRLTNSTSIDATANFRKAGKIIVNYNISTVAVQNAVDKQGNTSNSKFAQVNIRLADASDPVMMSCDIHTSTNGQQISETDNITTHPCTDVASAAPSQLLAGGERFTRRVKVDGNTSSSANSTMVINFSYL